MKQPTKECANCGKVFAKNQNVSMREWRNQTKYCSYECYGKAQRKHCDCAWCGKVFWRPSFGARPKFCSRSCSYKMQSKERRIVRRPCAFCGEPVKKAAAKYCTVQCRRDGYNGSAVYNYVGEGFRKNAYPVDYAWWFRRADEIRERDKVCRHCGMTPEENGRALDVHHIIPYRVSQDNSYSNLIALCRSCHAKADNEYDARQS